MGKPMTYHVLVRRGTDIWEIVDRADTRREAFRLMTLLQQKRTDVEYRVYHHLFTVTYKG